MVEALKEPGNENEREKAAASLLETLLALLDKLADDDVRSYSDALAALKELALERILGVLSNRLQADDRTTRLVAAAGLGFLKDERRVDRCSRRWQHPITPRVTPPPTTSSGSGDSERPRLSSTRASRETLGSNGPWQRQEPPTEIAVPERFSRP